MERRISARGWLGSMGGLLLVTVAGIAPGLNGGGQKIPGLSFPLGSARLGARAEASTKVDRQARLQRAVLTGQPARHWTCPMVRPAPPHLSAADLRQIIQR